MMSYVATFVFASSMLLTTSVFGSRIDEESNPPQNETVSVTNSKDGSDGSSLFEPPVRLSVDGDKVLNAGAEKMFLSPAIFDVDGDEKDELVVGTLMGDVGVHENQNASSEGDPVWSQWKALKDSKGKSIRTSNW